MAKKGKFKKGNNKSSSGNKGNDEDGLTPPAAVASFRNVQGGEGEPTGNLKLKGSPGDDVLNGGVGADRIYGRSGDDTIDGGAGDDRIKGGSGDDEISGGDGDDHIKGGRGNDVISGGGGDDRIDGGRGDDIIDGGAGDDRIKGGSGDDLISGGEGNDRLKGGSGDDDIFGGAGNDFIEGGEGADVVSGGAGDDIVEGGEGADTGIYTMQDNLGSTDVYEGGEGVDTLQLNLTYGEAQDADIIADVAAYEQFVAEQANEGGEGGEGGEGAAYEFSTIGLTASGWENVDVNLINTGPEAADDTGETDEDNSVVIDVLANDTDSDHLDVLSVVQVSVASGGGSASIVNNQVVYDPGQGYQYLTDGEVAEVEVSYTISDIAGATSTATIMVTVTGSNNGPVAVADTAATDEDTSVTIDVLANDSAPGAGNSHTVDNVSVTNGLGAVSIVGNQVVYDPGSAYQSLAVGETAQVELSYTMSDVTGAPSTSTISVTVTGTNDGPVAVADTGTTDENASITIDVLANDTDVDLSDTHTVGSVSVAPGQGTAAIIANQVAWTPGTDFDYLAVGETVTVVVDYTMSDNHGVGSSSTLTLTVTGSNDAPVIAYAPGNDAGQVVEDSPASISGQLGSTDVDNGATAAWSVVDGNGVYGLISVDPSGQWNYALNNGTAAVQALADGEVQTETFTIVVTDEHRATDSQDVVITVTGTNDAPVITSGDTTGDVSEDGVLTATGVLNVTDVDNGAVLAWSVDGGAPGASQDIAYGTPTYTVALDQLTVAKNGDGSWFNDDFSDGNPPPSGDFYPNGSPADYNTSGVFSESGGRMIMDGTGAGPTQSALFTSIPFLGHFATLRSNISNNPADLNSGLKIDDDFSVAAVFDLTIPDENGEAYGVRLTDRVNSGSNSQPGDDVMELVVRRGFDGAVRIQFRERDFDAPEINNIESVLLNAPAGADQISLLLNHEASSPGIVSASLDFLANGVVVGSHDFSSTGEIFGTETPANAADDELFTRAQIVSWGPGEVESSTLAGTYGTLTILQNGQWTYNLNNGALNVQALAQGQQVIDSFAVTVHDEHGATDTETIDVTVTGSNDGPVAVADTASATENTPEIISAASLLANDSDIDAGDTLSISSVGNAANGTVSLDGNGDVVFTPATGFVGSTTFDYTVSDGNGGSSTATVTVDVSIIDQTIIGTNGNDVLIGASGNDTIIGLAGDDTLEGGSGNDIIRPGDNTFGDGDFIVGGIGNDTIDFETGQGWYILDYSGLSGSISVDLDIGQVDKGANGTDTILNFESIDFNGGGLQVNGTSGNDVYIGSNDPTTWMQFRGGAGDDTITGGNGTERLDYRNALVGVDVDLAAQIATEDGFGGTDTILGGIDEVRGSNFTDVLTGSAADERFIGRTGDDVIDGGGGWDTIRYNRSGVDAVNVNLETGVATGTWSGVAFTHTLSNIESVAGSRNSDDVITGSSADNWLSGNGGNDQLFGGDGNDGLNGGSGNDTMLGGTGDDWFNSGAGNDLIDGGTGWDHVGYDNDPGGIIVNLSSTTQFGVASGQALDGYGGTDTLLNINSVSGSNHNDIIIGSDDTSINETFNGMGGNDFLDGGAGWNHVGYWNSSDGVTVDLNLQDGTTAQFVSASQGTDTLFGFSGLSGSVFNDDLTGNADGNFLEGNGGDDFIDGGAGFDTAGYWNASAGVTVDLNIQDGLTAQAVGGGLGSDTLVNIEGVSGSNLYGDQLIGNDSNNWLTGEGGNDILEGRGGVDNMRGGAGSDVFVFGPNSDQDSIDDFSSVGGDQIDVSGYGISSLSGLTISDDGVNTTIDFGGGNSVLLNNVLANSISAADFVFSAISIIQGTSGDDVLTGTSGNDLYLTGDASFGNGDWVNATAGNDTIDFETGQGFYTLNYGNLAGPVSIDLSTATIDKGVDGTDTLLNLGNIDYNNGGLGIFGTSANDVYIGQTDANSWTQFRGGAGDDVMTGGAGFERLDYRGAAAGVTVTMSGVGSGTTTQDGFGSTDTFSGIEEIRGTNFSDVLTGSVGNDRFITRLGDDIVDGGAGFDTVRYDRSGVDAMTIDLGTGTASGTWNGQAFTDTLTSIEAIRGSRTGDDVITGSAADESLTGKGGNDTLDGGAGNDFLRGDSGNDTLQGGDGDDSFRGDSGNDLIFGGAGHDWIRESSGDDIIDGGAGFDTVSYRDNASSSITYTGGNGGAASTVTGTSTGTDTLTNVERVEGTNFNDTFNGGDGDERFDAMGGVDVINGGAGWDQLAYQNMGNGSVGVTINFTGGGAGTAIDTDGNTDSFTGIEAALGSNGADVITGSVDSEQVFATHGSDTLDGGGGSDEINYGALWPQTQGAVVNLATETADDGAGGTDTILNFENVYGSNFSDTITGDAGNNNLNGGFGGNDTLDGGAGSDWLSGGSGSDLFVFSNGNGVDTITDFQAGALTDDDIDLVGHSGANSLADVQNAATQVGSNTIIDLGSGDSITLLGVNVNDLHQDDFIF